MKIPLRTLQPKTPQHAAGFTLIELVLVLSITGILMSVYLPLIMHWASYRLLLKTRDNMQTVRVALAEYYSQNSTYPCPGPMIDPTTDYANSDSCLTDAGGANARGVYFATNAAGYTVVEGGVPYTRLNIPKEAAYDGWGNLLVYAISANATVNFNGGANIPNQIGIVDHTGKSLITPPQTAIWALLSHGRDGSGAYTGNDATPNACDASHYDSGNCAHNGQYVVDDFADIYGPTHYDDLVIFRTWVESPPSPQPGYCHLSAAQSANLGGQSPFIQEGELVNPCGADASNTTCQWLICRSGTLEPAVRNVPTESDSNGP